MARFCEQCGAAIDPNNKFCQTCGKPTSPSTVAPPPLASAIVPVHPAMEVPADYAKPLDLARAHKLQAQAAQVDPSQRDEFLVSMCEGDTRLLQYVRGLFPAESNAGAPATGAAPPATEQTSAYFIGVYRLLRELGRGGMGVVYLAVRDDGAFRKNVALKLLLRECVTAEFISRFKQERQVLAALDHPNIARILDGGDTPDGMPYYVMEYVEGVALDRYCDQQRLSLTARLKIFQQVCQAVDYLHQNSILHRDLKPSNILVSSDGVVKLLDFGIAKVVGAGSYANPELTTAQGRPMTPTYASPEQLSGATLHKTSDIYSLGAILYALLTGRSAYNDLDDKLARIAARETPTKPSTNIREDLRAAESTAQFRRAMMGELDSIVLMAMQIDPKDRYQSAAGLTEDLQHFLDGSPVTAHHSSAAHRGVKLLRRKWAAVAVVCGFLLLGGVGAWQFARLEHQKSEAARLGRTIDDLEARLNREGGTTTAGAIPVEDVRRLKEAFHQDFGTSPNQDGLLARGIHYLDRVKALAAKDPKLTVQVGAAYQQLGTLQQQNLPGSQANATALTTLQKAAATLAAGAAESGNSNNQVKQQLASVNAQIRSLGGTAAVLPDPAPVQEATPPPAAAEPVTAQTRPVLKAPQRPILLEKPVAAASETPPPPPGNKPLVVSADTEDRLASVAAKVQIAEQTIEPTRQSLARDGQTLNADTLTRIARMHSSLERAQRAVAAGNEADAKESLSIAEALADKLLHSVGR